MNQQNTSFDKQNLTINSGKWSVELDYENWHSDKKEIKPTQSDIIIELSEEGNWDSVLRLVISNEDMQKTCLIKGIQGSSYLHLADEKGNSQSVKIDDNNLIISLGFNFISLNLNQLTLNWNLKPDMAEVFEFYDFQNDYLLRGEVEIHRIDKKGQIKWSYGGRDIWVNMEGKPEVQIEENTIRLLDFDSNEYLIDFDGNTLEDNPIKKTIKPKRKWWQLNK
ncbi:hypothetical protein A9Q87_10970 [Flavobacteriales bacterium 34_180_T64]|nr:hypothetical protein A9Q87_10970 [Flavobacteriales bacterium 34_180_T64]